MTKEQIRTDMKLKRNGLMEQERAAYHRAIFERLLQSYEYINCSSLFTYVSFGSEVDTCAIIQQARKDKKKVYVPRVEGNSMAFYLLRNLESLLPSKFGVPEPEPIDADRYRGRMTEVSHDNANKKAFLEDKKDSRVMLLPGLAFDRSGNRIGYGAGYYDRYLADYTQEHFFKIALAYDFQLIEQIVSAEYDRKADAIITPTIRLLCR